MSTMEFQTLHQCDLCPVNPNAVLKRSGEVHAAGGYVIALSGNPNVGKSTVFNALTGLRQHTGNWPGKTVARAEGTFTYQGRTYTLIDLPGTYSLLSASTDEEIARDFILFGEPEVTVVVTDATQLERNLNLVLQVLEITEKAVVCVNLIDEARRHGVSVDTKQLSRDLGVPVVGTAARSGEGLPELLRVIHQVAIGGIVCKPRRVPMDSGRLRAVRELQQDIEAHFPGLPNSRWVALRLLEGDERIIQAVRSGELHGLQSMRQNGQPAAAVTEGQDHA